MDRWGSLENATSVSRQGFHSPGLPSFAVKAEITSFDPRRCC
jgi:hypothetical protein